MMNLKLDSTRSTVIIWTTDINGPHNFMLHKFGDILYNYNLVVFAWPLI